MELKLKPRFFFLIGCLLLGGILYGSNVLLKKKVEIKVVDSKDSGSVLAAQELEKNPQDPYKLVGGDIGGRLGGDIGSSEQTSNISQYEPITVAYTVKEGDTLQSIAKKYHADAQTIADFPNNGLRESLQLTVGQVLIIPNGYIEESHRPTLPPIAHGTGQFIWPAEGVISQYAFSWHPGAVDVASDLGSPIRAADSGTVVTVEHLIVGYGEHVIIDHGDGLTSLYAHMSQINVVEGQGISKGDLIGLSGSTGRSTGPHLHFEVRRNGIPVDPMTLLSPR